MTEIKLATMDEDGDAVFCAGARFVEAGDLNQMDGVDIQKVDTIALVYHT